ncbi:hypothetical protein PAESOLCIP111_03442 [Paenibacillus solanacearum]|uniref:Heme NO-binding domain-containing protein n=1 Tax=Paenibacillus solanacearum TaxID=2048548 RepID=A0A916K2J1_9BACL|nr:heme NO-binding domain-containing protein [Paenibacillus solanacearum]CAG7633061.1 hypothetical protein PAESOLCIP111_03442 [Paenibacillus solanacearum]
MKGIVFTMFLEMVESRFSPAMAEHIIEDADLPSGGSYTTVGTYDHAEIIQLVVQLSKRTNIPVFDLVKSFGHYLFGQLALMVPKFISDNPTVFDFLQKVDGYIHVEVRKLYPDAELPAFEYETPEPGTLIMTYRSARSFADLAEGLIGGCIEHYGEKIDLLREDLPGGSSARFILTERR